MKQRDKPLIIPAFGVIKGGRLNGWRFHFLHFRATPEALQVVARCTPPAWPFPCDIRLTHEHFMQLRAVPGERARRMAVEPLIRHAYALAGLEVPAWALLNRTTLRSRVKRASGRTARATT
jgi:hypothetical protein